MSYERSLMTKENYSDISDLLEFKLYEKTSPLWAQKVVENFGDFLKDHAAAEKKAMSTALSMIAKYPNRVELVETMLHIAKEELEHYEQVTLLIHKRGEILKNDEKDTYIHQLFALMRNGVQESFLDRLVLGAIVENRGCERFAMVAQALPEGHELKEYYDHLSREEAKHYGQYIKLARMYFTEKEIRERLEFFLQAESEIIRKLPIRAMLH